MDNLAEPHTCLLHDKFTSLFFPPLTAADDPKKQAKARSFFYSSNFQSSIVVAALYNHFSTCVHNNSSSSSISSHVHYSQECQRPEAGRARTGLNEECWTGQRWPRAREREPTGLHNLPTKKGKVIAFGMIWGRLSN